MPPECGCTISQLPGYLIVKKLFPGVIFYNTFERKSFSL